MCGASLAGHGQADEATALEAARDRLAAALAENAHLRRTLDEARGTSAESGLRERIDGIRARIEGLEEWLRLLERPRRRPPAPC